MNRGIARRTLFEHADDIRYFLAQVAWAVHRGEIEIHAYSILTTHYHLLVRSLTGELGRAMQRIQTKYSRRFNRGRRRDGSLVRGRFGSRPVLSTRYRQILVRYIDKNPVQARLCVDPADYPHGSAYHYARLEGPIWLERSWIEQEARRGNASVPYSRRAYSTCFAVSSASLDRLVEVRGRTRGERDDLDDLVGAAPPRVLEWMRRKATLADGTVPGLPVVDSQSVAFAIGAPPQVDRPGGKGRKDWRRVARVGLERELSCSTFAEIGRSLGITATAAWKLHGIHGRWMLEDEDYANAVARAACAALATCDSNPGALSAVDVRGGEVERGVG